LGPVIELTDLEDDEGVDLPMRLAPRPLLGIANAVASGSGTRHSDSNDVASEVGLVDYDAEFAAKPFPFDEAFNFDSQKTPLQPSTSRRPLGSSRACACPPHPSQGQAIDNSSQPPPSSFRARAAHTSRLPSASSARQKSRRPKLPCRRLLLPSLDGACRSHCACRACSSSAAGYACYCRAACSAACACTTRSSCRSRHITRSCSNSGSRCGSELGQAPAGSARLHRVDR
jgi:hypothetical protein